MRVLLAAIFVYVVMIGSVGLIGSAFEDRSWPWWTMALPTIAMLAAMTLALFVFNRSGYRPSLRRKSLAERIVELEARGLLLREPFQAIRAFEVEPYNDEGPHYYLELADGRVLYLNGQYLYDYEPITGDPEVNQPRSFPCTDFEVLRHKDAEYVIHIQCAGTVLQPEITAPPFTREAFRRGLPDDGEIITDRSYESIKRAPA